MAPRRTAAPVPPPDPPLAAPEAHSPEASPETSPPGARPAPLSAEQRQHQLQLLRAQIAALAADCADAAPGSTIGSPTKSRISPPRLYQIGEPQPQYPHLKISERNTSVRDR
mmetsp:Transcript_29033/g.66710  ORF Transcript_29033/g.66710 Transcript_29033/m.66710 type:complete len:112 (+) Transcript_29033:1626-1961(+)